MESKDKNFNNSSKKSGAIKKTKFTPYSQKERHAIMKLMKRYNLSEEEAKRVLFQIKQKFNEKEYEDKNQINLTNPKTNSLHKNDVESEGSGDNNKDVVMSDVGPVGDNNNEKQDVDNILSGIIPDYNKNVSIEVEHLNLSFEVSKEKVDNLKEAFIRFIKRNRSEKIKLNVLKDISFKIYKGEKIGIIGYNGAGKSTLLKVICGIYNPDSGTVKTNGNISPLLSLGSGFDKNYSGRQNIIFNGAVMGYDRQFLESKVDEIIEFADLGEFIDYPIKNYSSGMLSKLGFAIATAVEPDILIIDEILGVGDASFSKKSKYRIRSLMDAGTTVILVSHSIPQVREICDKAIWIDNGSIREIGEVNKVCDHYMKDAEKASNEQLANIKFK